MSKGYIVYQLNKTVTLSVLGLERTLPLTYGDGMIGVMPVFSTQEDAEKFAGEGYQIGKVTMSEVVE